MDFPLLPAPRDLLLHWTNSLPDSERHADTLTMAFESLLFTPPEGREPYQELVDAAMRTGPDRQRTLVHLAAILLKRWIGGHWKPALAGAAQFNLLQLCANLEGAEELASLVWQVYHQRHTLITNDYPQANLPAALVAAMIRNQPNDPSPDSSCRSFWLNLLEERFPAGISATLADGFYGFVRMPHWATADRRQTENALAQASASILLRARDTNRPDLAQRLMKFIPETLPGLNLPRIHDLAANLAVVRSFERKIAPIAANQNPQTVDVHAVCRQVEAQLLSPNGQTRCNEAAVLTMLRLAMRPRACASSALWAEIRKATLPEAAAPESVVGQEAYQLATLA